MESHMRLLRRLIATIFMLFALLAIFGYWQWQRLSKEFGIEDLHFQFGAIHWQQLQLDELSFRYTTAQTDYLLTLEQLSLNWYWHSLQPQLSHGKLQRLKLAVHQNETSSPPISPFSLPKHWQLPNWLPAEFEIIEIRTMLPCATGECPVGGNLKIWQQSNQHWLLTLALSPALPTDPERLLKLKADYRIQGQLPQLIFELDIASFLSLQAETELVPMQTYNWQGHLALEVSPPPEWLLATLSTWGISYDLQKLQAFTRAARAMADWKLSLTDGSQLTSAWLSSADTQLNVQLNLPNAVPIPKLGLAKGFATVSLATTQGQVAHYQANADLIIQEPLLPKAWLDLGISITSAQLKLSTASDFGLHLSALPLQLQLLTNGDTQMQLDADLLVDTTSSYALTINNGKLSLRSSALALNNLSGEKFDLKTTFNGRWHDQIINLTLTTPTILSTQVESPWFTAQQCQLSGDQLSISGKAENWQQLSIDGSLRLEVGSLTSEHLLTQSWQWQSTIHGQPDNFVLDALLTNTSDLRLHHQLSFHENLLDLNWQLEDIFFLAGNPVRKTLKDWPELLDINRGRISATGNLDYDPQKNTLTSVSQITFHDINAIYDRSLLQGLSAQLSVQTLASQLEADAHLRIEQLNQGIVFGPLVSDMRYQTNFDKPFQGTLDLAQLKVAVMGGEVSLAQQSLDLTQAEHILPFMMTDIELAQLLKQHPSAELSGSGRLSGRIPVRIGPREITIETGTLAAIAPGGQLQYRPENTAAIVGSNKAMKMVVDALNDFHYSVLSSDVSYDNKGTLMLGLKLSGSNPAFEGGRAINLNINLEEDLPALLTSLQLSSQISDKIKQRVQQRFLKKQGKTAPTGAKHEGP